VGKVSRARTTRTKLNKSMQALHYSPNVTIDIQFSTLNLPQLIDDYERMISEGDLSSYNYWYLGLAYLVQERELDAQSTWFIPFTEASELESAVLTSELSDVLDRVASQEFTNHNYDGSWLISQYLREVDATHLTNLLRSILLAIKLDLFTPEDLVNWRAIEVLSTDSNLELELDRELLGQVVGLLLNFPAEDTYDFICQCLLNFELDRSYLIELIANTLLSLSHRLGANTFMTQVLDMCLEFQPKNTLVLQILCRLNLHLSNYQQATEISFLIYSLCNGSAEKIIANVNIIVTLMTTGDWQKILPIIDRHDLLLETLIDCKHHTLAPAINQGILTSAIFLPYTADRPDYFRSIQNQLAQIYLNHNQFQPTAHKIVPAALPKKIGTIRIGYLASTLRSHSVGWLSRWLWQHHDHEKFQIFTYCINQNPDDPFYQKWFRDRSDIAYCFGNDPAQIAAQIKADNVDILIDLDSLTLDTTCQVLAAKPAPIQITWLGWDATGLPTVDYFIADRYVLPENAQDYYQEKIWRLPHSYVAVDGFEIGTPTISRKDLNIPNDAIIYWSGQRGYKRHAQTIRSQLEILKSVPNSYLLIKGESDRQIIEQLFGKIAEQVGVDLDRLRFLNTVADEYTHRANLEIADIVLDTFPYNGATTTLETLWMGIPMVTQVGQQFAARNSYTFMLNAGIDQGIATNEQEYVEWGVKLGLDRDLRDTIAGKLRSGRTTAPLWNAKQFTIDLEQAYSQMWAKYVVIH
jgi:predicted O-linked N-acetylglucosamine transferase (SPINDLY family)